MAGRAILDQRAHSLQVPCGGNGEHRQACLLHARALRMRKIRFSSTTLSPDPLGPAALLLAPLAQRQPLSQKLLAMWTPKSKAMMMKKTKIMKMMMMLGSLRSLLH